MAYDEPLAERVRKRIAKKPGYMERKMFGGVCFLINGNMCTGAWNGSLVVRLDKEMHEQTQAEPHTRPMNITGKVMKGWALVEPAGIESDDDLKAWVRRAAAFAASLPAK